MIKDIFFSHRKRFRFKEDNFSINPLAQQALQSMGFNETSLVGIENISYAKGFIDGWDKCYRYFKQNGKN